MKKTKIKTKPKPKPKLTRPVKKRTRSGLTLFHRALIGPKSKASQKQFELTRLKPMLTTAELAIRWSMSARTLDNWRSQGRGPKFVKLTRRKRSNVLYRLSDVMRFEQSHVQKRA